MNESEMVDVRNWLRNAGFELTGVEGTWKHKYLDFSFEETEISKKSKSDAIEIANTLVDYYNMRRRIENAPAEFSNWVAENLSKLYETDHQKAIRLYDVFIQLIGTKNGVNLPAPTEQMRGSLLMHHRMLVGEEDATDSK